MKRRRMSRIILMHCRERMCNMQMISLNKFRELLSEGFRQGCDRVSLKFMQNEN